MSRAYALVQPRVNAVDQPSAFPKPPVRTHGRSPRVAGCVAAECVRRLSLRTPRELRSLWLRGRVLPVLDSLGVELSRVFGGPVSWSLPLLEAEQEDVESRRRQRRALAIGTLMARGLSREDAVGLSGA